MVLSDVRAFFEWLESFFISRNWIFWFIKLENSNGSWHTCNEHATLFSSTPSRLAKSRLERKERFSILPFFNKEIFIRAINTLSNLPSVITIVAVENIFSHCATATSNREERRSPSIYPTNDDCEQCWCFIISLAWMANHISKMNFPSRAEEILHIFISFTILRMANITIRFVIRLMTVSKKNPRLDWKGFFSFC